LFQWELSWRCILFIWTTTARLLFLTFDLNTWWLYLDLWHIKSFITFVFIIWWWTSFVLYIALNLIILYIFTFSEFRKLKFAICTSFYVYSGFSFATAVTGWGFTFSRNFYPCFNISLDFGRGSFYLLVSTNLRSAEASLNFYTSFSFTITWWRWLTILTFFIRNTKFS